MDLGLSFLAPIAEQQRMDQAAQLAPAQLAHTLALTRLDTARAAQAEQEVEGERKAAAVMAQKLGVSGGSGSMSDFMMSASEELFKQGLFTKGAGLADKASAFRAHEATRQAAIDRADHARLLDDLTMSKTFADLLYGVKSPKDWDLANRALEAKTGRKSPYAGLPYDPKTVETLSRGAMTATERANLAIRDRAERSLEGARASTAHHQRVLEGIAEARLGVTRGREARLSKEGGKDVGEPSPGETAHAKNLLKSQSGLVDPDDLDVAADDLAARARQKRKQAPGLSAEEARRRALMEMKAEGAFQAGTPGKKILGVQTSLGAEKGAYAPAEPLPAKKSDWKVGVKYKDGGVTGIWTGTKFVPVGTKVAPARRSGGTVEEEEPDE